MRHFAISAANFSISTLVFTTLCIIVQSTVLRSHVICPSVCPSVCDVGGTWRNFGERMFIQHLRP